MECTQRIECTQELFSESQKPCPKQIGFLGICGSKYPLNKGPNKIGRDPGTCDIVLDVNSISRHHAVINVLSEKNIMLMDLGSSNKTMLLGTKLQPYIPHPLRNGDTIQFGQVFGIFRLLEDDDELPLTQAVDIPETPIRQVPRMKIGQSTTIPESPDISDREDSIIVQSHQNQPMTLKSTNNIMKPTVQNKINNLYWNSSKKSDSFTSNFEENPSPVVKNISVSPRKLSMVQNSIFDMETQAPNEVEPQRVTDSIYDAKTQIPCRKEISSIYNLETQIPNIENLPEVYKVQKQSNVQLNLFSTANKNVDNNIFDAETQIECDQVSSCAPLQKKPTDERNFDKPKTNLNTSDEEIHFDDFDSQPFEDICESQPLLIDSCDIIQSNPVKVVPDRQKDQTVNVIVSKESSTTPVTLAQNDDDDTDCEDIFDDNLSSSKSNRPTVDVNSANQKGVEDCNIPKSMDVDDDLTDCEDDVIEISQNKTKVSDSPCSPIIINDLPTQVIGVEEKQIMFHDELTQVIEDCPPTENVNSEGTKENIKDINQQVTGFDQKHTKSKSSLIQNHGTFKVPHSASSFISSPNKINDLPTQVIPVQEDERDVAFEDQLTQVIEDYSNDLNAANKKDNFEDLETQVIGCEEEKRSSKSPLISDNKLFKVPQVSPRHKRTEPTCLPKRNSPSTSLNSDGKDEDANNYYNATQDIMLDLCTQKEPESRDLIRETSSEGSDNEKIESFVSGLSKTQIREVIGVDIAPVSKKNSNDSTGAEEYSTKVLGNTKSIKELSKDESSNQEIICAEVSPTSKKNLGNSSDQDSTPNLTPSKFLMINLPSSQDIKSCQFLSSQNSDSNSDPFEDTQDQEDIEESTSVVYRRKQKRDIKKNLIKNFDATALPTRAITRIRKPTSKILDSDDNSKKMTEKILQSRLGLNNKIEIDGDVILSNLARLRKRAKNKANNMQPKRVTEIKHEKSNRSLEYELNSDSKTQEKITKYLNETHDSNLKPDSKHTSNDNKGSSRSKSIQRKNEKMKSEAEAVKTESRELVSRSSRTHRSHNRQKVQETIDLSSEEEEPVRRSKRNQASNENNGKSHGSKKENKDTTKTEKRKRKNSDSKNENSQSKKEHKEKNELEKESAKIKGKNNEKLQNSQKKERDSTVTEEHKSINSEDKSVSQGTRKGKRGTMPLEKERSKNDDNSEKSQITEREKNEITKQEENRYSKRTRSKLSNRTNHDRGESRSNTEKGVGNLKRQASGDIHHGNDKKARSSTVSTLTPTRGIKTHRILFTAFPSETVSDKLEKFGGVIVSDVYSATVVLTLTIRRTFKLLCAIGLGKPIVGPNWVQACVDSGMIVDPWQYLINDVASEKRFGFSLKKSLSCERNFLKGYNISCTPNVSPNPLEMQAIVECSGGTWREGREGRGAKGWFCVSSAADAALQPALRRRGATVVSNEFVLGGVLRQRLLDQGKFLLQ